MEPSIVVCHRACAGRPGYVEAFPAQTFGRPAIFSRRFRGHEAIPAVAATGVDALVHSLEAYLATGFHPMADGVALEGMRLVIENLPAAYRDGSNLGARAGMLIASAMGATAFQKGLGMIHSLGHPLSARKKMHHGLACALVTPASLEFIERSDLGGDDRKRLETVRRLFADAGVEGDTLSAVCRSFMESLGIEFGLANHGVAESDLDQLAEDAFRDPCHPTNMVPVTKEDLLAAYKSAM